MSTRHPSMSHLEHHQRHLEQYRANVVESARDRFGPAWWGLWDQHVDLPADATVVDLGTGPATFLARLRERMPDARLVGVELHPSLLELAQETAAGIDAEILQADLALPVPLPDASVDAVASALVFHELPHPPALLDNAARLLKPGGRLVLFDIVKHPLSVYMQGREFDEDSLDHFREHCLFTPDDLVWMVERVGLRVDEVILRDGGRFAMVIAHRPDAS